MPADEVVEHLRRLAFDPQHVAVAEHEVAVDPATRDFLKCTHGAVNACCATFGYPMYQPMRSLADRAATSVPVWRAAHFGGRRLAATALEAPEGRYGGRLKADMRSPLIRRSRAAGELRGT